MGTRERLVLELAIGTAQRRGDLVRLGWRHVADGAILIKQNKTGATVTVPRPLGAASLGNEFHDWLRKAGLPEKLSLHGLRKAAARRLAEAGSTVHEIAAVTGHKTLSEVERYTREAEKTRLAASGMAKIVAMLRKPKS